MKYSFRKSAFEKEKSYELTESGIQIIDHDGTQSTIFYDDIQEVNPSYMATKNNSFYQCILKLRSGEKVLIKSQHYRGIADFEDRSADYAAFIVGLHKVLTAAGQGIVYKKGIGKVAYFFSMLIFIVASILFPLSAIGMLVTGNLPFGAIALILSIFLIMRMIKYSKKNKPGHYTPDDIPKALLPATA